MAVLTPDQVAGIVQRCTDGGLDPTSRELIMRGVSTADLAEAVAAGAIVENIDENDRDRPATYTPSRSRQTPR